ncbi:hypothetical protein, conserved [Angomonas deanei]|uniref:Uncharacterized protein n=1 Tax=Angomonas deanei TaxID=59799 RepID=A0A7G2CDH9_9TRYP|nr:hypothetical protein, conserved [Angomonas deanei]
MAAFLCRSVLLKTVDAKNNALLCCAALLLDLSCVIHDFAEHLRATCLKEIFGCCVITNAPDQLDTLSGKFIDNAGDEMSHISDWINPSRDAGRVEYTLSIGGESGSGKTRAALQCAKLIEGRKENDKADKDYLTVYIKLSEEDDQTLSKELIASYFDTKEDKEAAENYITKNGIKGAQSVDDHMRREDTTKEDRNRLRIIRARLCADLVRRKIKEITEYSVFDAKIKFKQVFFVFDEAASCPWIYRSVNQVLGGKLTLSELFGQQNPFAEKIKVVCCSTANEAVFRNMLSTQGAFYPVIMGPCRKVYEELVKGMKQYVAREGLLAELLRNYYFAKLVENRRCGVFAAEVVTNMISYTDLGEYPFILNPTAVSDELLLSDTDKEGAYSIAGFIVSIVAARYKQSNGTKGKSIPEARRLAATSIRDLLSTSDKNLWQSVIVKDGEVAKMGMFSVINAEEKTTVTNEAGETQEKLQKRMHISMSAAQLVMYAMTFGKGTLFTMDTHGGAFESYSGPLFSLFLDGCSSSYYGGERRFTLAQFFERLCKTTLKEFPEIKLNHSTVAPVKFATHQIGFNGKTPDYLGVLGELSKSQEAFVVVNRRGAPYADLIAKSGQILFLIQCKASVNVPKFSAKKEVEKMGFSEGDDQDITSLVDIIFPPQGVLDKEKLQTARKMIDFRKGNLREQLKNCVEELSKENVGKEAGSENGEGGASMASEKKERNVVASGNTTDDLDAALLKGKLTTTLLMRSLGCTIAVPVFICSDVGGEAAKDTLIGKVQGCSVNSFAWNNPAAVLFAEGGLERIVEDEKSSIAPSQKAKRRMRSKRTTKKTKISRERTKNTLRKRRAKR